MLRWYALRTRAQAEKLVARGLESRSIEHYWPMREEKIGRQRRQEIVPRSFFPGYVFARFEFAERRPVITTPYVVDIVRFGPEAIAIADEEIDAVRRVLEASLAVVPASNYIPGDRVIVRKGPLTGIEGYVVHAKNSLRLIVAIDMLHRGVSAEIDAAAIEHVARVPRSMHHG